MAKKKTNQKKIKKSSSTLATILRSNIGQATSGQNKKKKA